MEGYGYRRCCGLWIWHRRWVY